jgi:hypothetical protein
LRDEIFATLLKWSRERNVNQALEVEARGRQPLVLEAILGFLKVPKVCSLVCGAQPFSPEGRERLLADADFGFPDTD